MCSFLLHWLYLCYLPHLEFTPPSPATFHPPKAYFFHDSMIPVASFSYSFQTKLSFPFLNSCFYQYHPGNRDRPTQGLRYYLAHSALFTGELLRPRGDVVSSRLYRKWGQGAELKLEAAQSGPWGLKDKEKYCRPIYKTKIVIVKLSISPLFRGNHCYLAIHMCICVCVCISFFS